MMSLDGFIAGPDDSMDWAFEQSGASPIAHEVRDATGAIVAGRRWYELATERWNGSRGIYGGRWQGLVFVLTHDTPESTDDPAVRFVSDGIEDAISRAQAAAGEKRVGVFGASIARQCLDEGLLDEIVVHIAPVMLGDGVRLYGGDGARQVKLERTAAPASEQVTDLRFRVVR
jgi:dihydrofolate reductase